MTKKKIKVLSLFDGMSGGQLALQELGLTPSDYEYYASEIKPHGIKVTAENFPNTVHIGDVTKVRFEDGVLYTEKGDYTIGRFDIVMGGSPCQNFSIACITEKRKGLEGDKSKLFYEYLRILREVNPEYFLLENVSSMDKYSRSQLDEYMGVEGVDINSKVLVGALRGRLYWTNMPFSLPLVDRCAKWQDAIDEGFVNKDKCPCLLEGHSRPQSDKLRLTRRYLDKSFIPVVFDSEEHYKEVVAHYKAHYKGLTAKEVDDIRDTIDNSVYNKVRILNSHEMERLQGVPVGYCDSVSRNDSASLLGDGWTIPVISSIMKISVEGLLRSTRGQD